MGDCANTGDRRSATRVPARAKPTPEAAAVHAVGFICRRTGSSLARSAPPLGDLDGGRASGCAKVAWRAFEGKHFTPSRGSACGEVMQDCLGQRGPWGDAPLRTAAPSRKRHSGGIAVLVWEARLCGLPKWERQEDRKLGSFRPRTFPHGRRDAHHIQGYAAGHDATRGEAREGSFARDRQFRLRTIGKGRTLCYRAGRTPRPAFLPPATLHLHQARRP